MNKFPPSIKLFITILIVVTAIHLPKPVFARDLGTFGDTYPIMEEDFLTFIQNRLSILEQQGEWKKVENAMAKGAEHYRDRPTPVDGISTTQKTNTFSINPGITLDHDVLDANGKLIAKAGSFVNPLIFAPLTKALIFYNSDDIQQVKWALVQDKSLHGKDKIILVKGSVLTEEKRFNKSVYFDQAGRLTNRFQIKHVPAIVEQSGMMLKITEMKP